jgi:serine/threonine protein kinase
MTRAKPPSASKGTRLLSIGDFRAKGKTIAAAGTRYHGTTPLENKLEVEDRVLAACQNGEVRMAFDEKGRSFAVKSIEKELCSEEHQDFLRREVKIHMGLNHPHILRLCHVFESDEKLDLVTELMTGGELYDKIVEEGSLLEKEAAKITFQLLLAVSYLHSHQIIHRDLKPENILFVDHERAHLKVIDFGMATTWDGKTGISHRCGTPCYYAPEMWTSEFNDKIDIWAIGLIVYEMLTGHSAYTGSKQNLMQKVKRGEVYYGSRFKGLSLEAQDFIRAVLTVDPQQRPSAAECLRHPWFFVQDSPRGNEEGVVDKVHHMHCKRICLEMLVAELSDDADTFQDGGDCAHQGKPSGWGLSESTTASILPDELLDEQRISTISSDGSWTDEDDIGSADFVTKDEAAEPEEIEPAQHRSDSHSYETRGDEHGTAQPTVAATMSPPAKKDTSSCWAWLLPCA